MLPPLSDASSANLIVQLTRQDEEELADHLDLGLSIFAAKEMRQKEGELAAMKLKNRENKRPANCGAISATSRNNEIRVGPWGMPSSLEDSPSANQDHWKDCFVVLMLGPKQQKRIFNQHTKERRH